MSGKTFIDTNILVYAADDDATPRRDASRKIIASLVQDGSGVVSTQVMQEFYVAATRKLGMPPLAAKAVLKTFAVFEVVQVSPELIHAAVDCSVLNTVSFWDALIIASASSAGCSRLFTEDLSSGQAIMGVAIENPL
ncbi:MAG: PIN domain-containing protein [Gemmatimonadaceae bacterium]